MFNRVYAAVHRLLSPRPEAEASPGTGTEIGPGGGGGDSRGTRKRPHWSMQDKEEQDDRQWKRFKMGDLVETVRHTAEGVRQTTCTVLSWVRSQSPSFSSPLAVSPARRRAPGRHGGASPPQPPFSHTQVSPSSLEDSFICPSGEPVWTPQPRPAPAAHPPGAGPGQRAVAERGQSVQKPGAEDGDRGQLAVPPVENAQDSERHHGQPGPAPAQFCTMYSKTFSNRLPESPQHSTTSHTSHQTHTKPTNRYLSTVEETICREEKELYRQLLKVVISDYSNKSSLSRVSSPLRHRELSGFLGSSQRLFQKMVSSDGRHTAASSVVSSEHPSWGDPSSSPLPASPPHAGNHVSSCEVGSSPSRSVSPALPEGVPGADTMSTGSDSESVIVVKVKEAPERDRASMPHFDALHWIKELTSMYDSRARERRRLIDEQEALADRLKQQRLHDKDILSKRVTAQLHLRVPLDEEIPIAEIPHEEGDEEEEEEDEEPRPQVEEEEEFPELSEEMEGEVRRAFRPGNPDEVLSEAFRLTITRKDIHTLNHLNWLNDEVINFYMNLLVVRGKTRALPTVHAFNTFFFPKVKSDGYQAVKRWTKKVDIFAMDILLVPIHLGVHWCLAVVDFRKKTVSYYDSMGGSNDEACRILL
ncbi:sentrin-specific protease 1, partial [Heptranchias perlo]|uniref:sentrin-specific protease 1 n=1 Tax=Heptranchias perlo TaxID=212740 RepID=UPI00355A5784